MWFGEAKNSTPIQKETEINKTETELKNQLSQKLTPEELELFNAKDILSSLDDDTKEALLNAIKTIPWFSKEIIANIDNFTIWNPKDIIESLVNKQKETQTQQKETIFSIDAKKIENIRTLTDKLVTELDITNHPDYKIWRGQAESELGKNEDFQKLSDGEKTSYINTYILIQNRSTFEFSRPDLKADFDKLDWLTQTDIILWIIKIPDDKFKNNPQILKRDLNFAKYSIIWNWDLTIKWNKIKVSNSQTWETQIIVLNENKPPKKFIEKYWYKIETTRDFPTEYAYQEQRDELKKQALQSYSKLSDKTKTKIKDFSEKWVNETISDVSNNINSKSAELKSLEEKLKNSSIEEQTKLYEQINELKKEIETLQKDLKVLEELQKVQIQAQEIEQQEQQRIPNFREWQQQADDKARDTLDFLNILWLTNISQDDLQQIINRINNPNPNTYWFNKKVSLEEWFSWDTTDINKWKRQLINAFMKIYEKMWIKLNPDEILTWKKNPEIENEALFKQKLENAWITLGWSLQIETTMKILAEKTEDKEKIKQN